MDTYEEEVIQSHSYLILIDLAADLDSEPGDYSLDQVQTVQSAEYIYLVSRVLQSTICSARTTTL